MHRRTSARLLLAVICSLALLQTACTDEPRVLAPARPAATASAAVGDDCDVLLAESPSECWVVTVTDIGAMMDDNSQAQYINNKGQVVGYRTTPEGDRGFLWDRGLLTELGTLGDGQGFLQPAGLNEHGQVAGTWWPFTGGARAFFWENGTLKDLGTLGGPGSLAYGLNDHGHVVGLSTTASEEERVVLWKDGRIIDIGGPTTSVFAYVNNHDVVAGFGYFDGDFGSTRAYRWENGVITQLARGDGSRANEVGGINRHGEVLLDGPAVWSRRGTRDLTALPGAFVNALNDRGQVTVEANGVVYLWDGSTVTTLPTPDGQSATGGALNDHGQVAGGVAGLDGNVQAVLWDRGRMIPLTVPGATRTGVNDINDRGQVAGSYTTIDADGNERVRAVVWTLERRPRPR